MPSCPGFLTVVGRREWWTVDQRRGWPGRRRRRVVSHSGGLQRIAAVCDGLQRIAADVLRPESRFRPISPVQG